MREQRRRARKAEAESTLTIRDWEYALEFFGNKCCYCRKPSEDIQQEHIVPLFKGGGYTPRNIIPACPTCNRDKFTSDLEEWFRRTSYFKEESLQQIKEYQASLSEGDDECAG